MDIESYYNNEFEKYDEDPDKYCSICYDEHNDTSIKLKCGHMYHYECIKDSYKLNKTSGRICPYCRRDGGYLPLMGGDEPEKNIHKEWLEQIKVKKPVNMFYNTKCKGIIKSGPNKNNPCSCWGLEKYNGYCGKHKKQYTGNINQNNEIVV